MTDFNLSITTDNAAFDDDNLSIEIARIMREVATRIERGEYYGSVRDINGNRIGSFSADAPDTE